MKEPATSRTKVADRKIADSLFSSLRTLPRAQYAPEILAGVTLLAIAVPEQLATAQLAEVPPFLAILAFIAASITFAMLGSNPIMSVGADSTIAPLFAVALVRLAAPESSNFLILVSATAVVTGALILLIGLLRLGWIADFLSVPIVAGFMTGIALTIMVHQLPNALGLTGVSGTIVHRVATVVSHLNHVNGWTAAVMVGTLLIVFMGERFNPRVPFALIAVVAAIIVTHFGNFAAHGVATLGKVAIVGPHWRLSGFSWSDAGVVATTAATVALVVISQSAATSRSVADEMNVEVNINQDFIALGLANLLSGVAGTIPVNASPARTGVVRVAGGKTSLVSLIAGLGALLVIFIAPALRDMPLAALAGVLFYVAGRLMKVKMLRQIAKVDRYEFALAIITAVAVILIGVQEGLAVAVGLAILDQLRRSARPRTAVLGRRPDSTSWEPLDRDGATLVDAVTVLLFTAPLYFINAQIFRTEVHSATRNYPNATHFVVDAAAITDVDFTGLSALAAVIADLKRDHVEVVFARASDSVVRSLKNAPSKDLNTVRFFGTVEEAVLAKRV